MDARRPTTIACVVATAAAIAAPSAHAQVPLPLPSGDEQPPAEGQEQPPAEGQEQPRESDDAAPRARERSKRRTQRPRTVVLSNERTRTRWAWPVARTYVRSRPSRRARRIAPLWRYTEDGYREVYLVLRSRTARDGTRWLEIRVPMRPNGRHGWVRRQALGRLRTVRTFLKVDRRRLRATLYRNGRRVWSAPVGVGARRTPTPAGRFWIREKIRPLRRGTMYGPLAFGTSAYSSLSEWPGGGVIGIHGTNQPELVPGRPSHGCIRVRNRAIKQLGRRMPIGTPVRIL